MAECHELVVFQLVHPIERTDRIQYQNPDSVPARVTRERTLKAGSQRVSGTAPVLRFGAVAMPLAHVLQDRCEAARSQR